MHFTKWGYKFPVSFRAPRCNFVGTIPDIFFKYITTLDLSYNFLTGTIPWDILGTYWVPDELWLDHNRLDVCNSRYSGNSHLVGSSPNCKLNNNTANCNCMIDTPYYSCSTRGVPLCPAPAPLPSLAGALSPTDLSLPCPPKGSWDLTNVIIDSTGATLTDCSLSANNLVLLSDRALLNISHGCVVVTGTIALKLSYDYVQAIFQEVLATSAPVVRQLTVIQQPNYCAGPSFNKFHVAYDLTCLSLTPSWTITDSGTVLVSIAGSLNKNCSPGQHLRAIGAGIALSIAVPALLFVVLFVRYRKTPTSTLQELATSTGSTEYSTLLS